MLFVALMKAKAGSTILSRTERRLDWAYPEGAKVIGEYWLTTDDPNVVTVVEANDVGLVFDAIRQWDDVFDIEVYPAVTAEFGIARARQQFAAALA